MGNKPILQSNKLVVGQLDLAHIPAVPAVPGTTVLNGPVWVGAAPPAVPIANCMIWPGINPITLDVTGIQNYTGTLNMTGIINATGTINRSAVVNASGAVTRTGISITNATSTKNGLNQGTSKNVFSFVTVGVNIKSPVYKGGTFTGTAFKGTTFTGTTCTMNRFVGSIRPTTGVNPDIAARIQTVRAIAQSKKPFDILHPTKKDHRLRYVALEGPAAEVYCRGKSESNIINLPDYWLGLVDQDSITVNLTPVGIDQRLFVEKIENNKVYVSGGSIINGETLYNYHYTVFAERKDTEKNIPEYKGLTPDDYPGDNSEYKL